MLVPWKTTKVGVHGFRVNNLERELHTVYPIFSEWPRFHVGIFSRFMKNTVKDRYGFGLKRNKFLDKTWGIY
jgi:hypothetical protein